MKVEINITRTDYKKIASFLMVDSSRAEETLQDDIESHLSTQAHDYIGKLPEMKLNLIRRELIYKTLVFLREATGLEISRYLHIPYNKFSGRITELLRADRIFIVKKKYDDKANRFVRLYAPVK